jgi:hypothetical protein
MLELAMRKVEEAVTEEVAVEEAVTEEVAAEEAVIEEAAEAEVEVMIIDKIFFRKPGFAIWFSKGFIKKIFFKKISKFQFLFNRKEEKILYLRTAFEEAV